MRITITTASAKTASATIASLLTGDTSELEIHGLYRNPNKAPAGFTAHNSFHAIEGSIDQAATLDFAYSDAVLVILPPLLGGEDPLGNVSRMCENVRNAAEKSATVKRIVLLSSYGAEFEKGVGELMTNNISEQVLSIAKVPEVTIARCAYFMENWTTFNPDLKSAAPSLVSTITPLDYKLPMVAVKDIGSGLARALMTKTPVETTPYIFDLHGPEDYSPLDVTQALNKVLGRDIAVKAVEKDQLQAFFAPMFSPYITKLYAEMTASILPGGVAAVDSTLRDTSRDVVRGQTTLEAALREALL